ncbi:hypothetical protein H4R33_006259, partial [Dimargaris cristalligena]
MLSQPESGDYKYVAVPPVADDKAPPPYLPPGHDDEPDSDAAEDRRRMRRCKKVVAVGLASLLLLGMTAFYARRSLCHGFRHRFNMGPAHHGGLDGERVHGSWEDTHRSMYMQDCEATIPYEGQTDFDFDASEYTHFAARVRGAAYSNVEIHVDESDATPEAEARIKVNAQVKVSDAELLRNVKIFGGKRKGGPPHRGGPHHHHPPGEHYSLMVLGPHGVRRGQCVRAGIKITIPKSLKKYDSIFLSYLAGKLQADSSLADLPLRFFHVANVAGDLAVDKIQAQVVVLNTVKGLISGTFDGNKATVLRTVSGNVDARVNPADGEHAIVKVQSVSGNVRLDVQDNYQGPFALASVSGHTEVTGNDVEFGTDLPHKKIGTHLHPKEDGEKSEQDDLGPNEVKTITIGSVSFSDLVSHLSFKKVFRLTSVHQKREDLVDPRQHLRPYELPKHPHPHPSHDDHDHPPHHGDGDKEHEIHPRIT